MDDSLKSERVNFDFNLTAVPDSFLTPLSLSSSSQTSPFIGLSDRFSIPTSKYWILDKDGFPIISTFLYS